jgi:hypothetical protein
MVVSKIHSHIIAISVIDAPTTVRANPAFEPTATRRLNFALGGIPTFPSI